MNTSYFCVAIIWYHGDGKTASSLERHELYSGVCVFSPPLPCCSQTPCPRSRDPVGNCPGSASGRNAWPAQLTHHKERYLARDASSHLWAQMALSAPAHLRRAWHVHLVKKTSPYLWQSAPPALGRILVGGISSRAPYWWSCTVCCTRRLRS